MDIVLSINKPTDITSHGAAVSVRKMLRSRKTGHAGTLDPMATGVLIICVSRATRLAQYFSSLEKEYLAVMKLGEATDTQDACGQVIERHNISGVDSAKIEEALMSFRGRIMQQPPMYSALKRKGRPLYELARKGIEVERAPREVFIHQMSVLDISIPFVTFRTVCSKGTYIRTICDDAGRKLGTGAHMTALERRAVGPFHIDASVGMDELASGDRKAPSGRGVYSMDEALSWMPAVTVSGPVIAAVSNGTPLETGQCDDFTDRVQSSPWVRIKSTEGVLLAVARYDAGSGRIRMDVVFPRSG